MRTSWVIAIGALAACGDGLAPDLELLTSRAKWERRGVADYSYQFQMYCECIDVSAVRLTVQDGIVVGGQYVEDGQPLPDEIPAYFRRTVDSLFAIIDDALRREADRLAVEYHPWLGHPTRIAVDYETGTADDEITYLASALDAGVHANASRHARPSLATSPSMTAR